MTAKDRAVIRAFHAELRRLGIRPEGDFDWTRKDARRFARLLRAGCEVRVLSEGLRRLTGRSLREFVAEGG